jgi:hypothetical protein
MARTLGRLKHMPDSSRSLASTHDTINTLINMTNSEDDEEVDAAVLALKNLSMVPSVGVLIADCSGLEVPFTSHIPNSKPVAYPICRNYSSSKPVLDFQETVLPS